MLLQSEILELRGVVNRQNKDGNVFYLVNCEEGDGSPIQFYVRNADVFPDGLRKGDNIVITFKFSEYNKEIRLSVVRIEKEA